MIEFLSEENVLAHREYLNTLRLKYSIFEKSFPSIKNKYPGEIVRQKMNREDKREALDLLCEILLHNIFFTSFSKDTYSESKIIRESFGGISGLVYEIMTRAKGLKYGFVCIYSYGGRAWFDSSSSFRKLVMPTMPILAIDLCEHAYFSDYGFDKERYLSSALSYLDTSRLEKNQK